MNRLRSCLVALAPIPLLSACNLFTGPGASTPPEPLTGLPRALTVAEQRVVAGSNDFAFALLRETARRDAAANVFLSPLSASMALGMAMNGARGETLDGMMAALGFHDVALGDANHAYRGLIELLRGLDSGVAMRLANSIWARQGFPFETSFYDTARSYFDARVTELDFKAPSAAATINDWVKQRTAGKIDAIVDAPIPPDIVLYLINAVYFKGSWRDRFDPADTRDAPFTTSTGATISVPMMHRTGDGAYFETDGVRGVELPYSRGAYVMDVVLPPAGTPLADFVAALDTAHWNGWLAALHGTELVLGLPRFRLDYETVLNDPLVALGMNLAFTPGRADFTGMSPRGKEMFISKVKQKTYVDVNEEGTEAAAVTSVGMGVTAVPSRITFTVDRPFLVAIRERFSGTILFLGAIGAPQNG